LFCGGRRWWKAEVFGQLRGKRKKSRGFSGAGDEGKKIPKGEAAAGKGSGQGRRKWGYGVEEKKIPTGGRLRLLFGRDEVSGGSGEGEERVMIFRVFCGSGFLYNYSQLCKIAPL
jgi:hypothetical protein